MSKNGETLQFVCPRFALKNEEAIQFELCGLYENDQVKLLFNDWKKFFNCSKQVCVRNFQVREIC